MCKTNTLLYSSSKDPLQKCLIQLAFHPCRAGCIIVHQIRFYSLSTVIPVFDRFLLHFKRITTGYDVQHSLTGYQNHMVGFLHCVLLFGFSRWQRRRLFLILILQLLPQTMVEWSTAWSTLSEDPAAPCCGSTASLCRFSAPRSTQQGIAFY